MKPMTVIIGDGGGVSPKPEPEQHEYVDLGLSVKWATCNIGANSPEEAGLYFAWGETQGYTAEQVGNEEGKRQFDWNGYEFGPDIDALTKYNREDRLILLELEDDAAAQIWGNGWAMPTEEDFRELISSANTETIFTEQNGVRGLLVTSKVGGYEGNSVFLPAVGYAQDGEAHSDIGKGFYWSASLNNNNVSNAWELNFEKIYYGSNNFGRRGGYSVRPVHI